MQKTLFICVNSFMNAYSLYFKHLLIVLALNSVVNLNRKGINSINMDKNIVEC